MIFYLELLVVFCFAADFDADSDADADADADLVTVISFFPWMSKNIFCVCQS